MFEDQEIKRRHGDRLVCGTHNKFAFRFRCGPVNKYNWAWSHCSCCHLFWRGEQGRVARATGSYRHPKTFNTLRAAEGFRVDGIKVRRSEFKQHLPTAWEDHCAHAEKNWKRHRKTQWK